MQTKRLIIERIEQTVPARNAGFYRLGTCADSQFFSCYFGRSDTDLQRRLFQHATAGEYEYFQAASTQTIYGAYVLECREWHLNGHRTDNEMHPSAPARIGYECPYCALRDAPRTDEVLQEVAR